MLKTYTKHSVSTKVALYSHDKQKVLVMRYVKSGLTGLPGGHVDKGEHPDDTLRRELVEELSLSLDTITRKDFFIRDRDGRAIILAYTAIAPENVSIQPTLPKKEIGEWVGKEDIAAMPNMVEAYKRFILENWPD